MCPRLRAVPRLPVETQSHLSWGWLSDPSLALCPCALGGSHHLAHPVHSRSCRVHRPTPLHLAVSPDASRGGPQRLIGDAWGAECGAVRDDLPYLPDGPLSPRVCLWPPGARDRADAMWAPLASLL